ncbi:hypothetical protein D3C76_1177860 [compost metagenome]
MTSKRVEHLGQIGLEACVVAVAVSNQHWYGLSCPSTRSREEHFKLERRRVDQTISGQDLESLVESVPNDREDSQPFAPGILQNSNVPSEVIFALSFASWRTALSSSSAFRESHAKGRW